MAKRRIIWSLRAKSDLFKILDKNHITQNLILLLNLHHFQFLIYHF